MRWTGILALAIGWIAPSCPASAQDLVFSRTLVEDRSGTLTLGDVIGQAGTKMGPTSANSGFFMAFSSSLARPKPDVAVICTDPNTPYTLDVRVGGRPASSQTDRNFASPRWDLLDHPPVPKHHAEAGRGQRNGLEAATEAGNRSSWVARPQSWVTGGQFAPEPSYSDVATVTVTY